MRTSKIQTISIPSEVVEQIESLAREEGTTKNALFQEALMQFIRRRRWRKLRDYGGKKAKELGVLSDADIERAVDEYRSSGG